MTTEKIAYESGKRKGVMLQQAKHLLYKCGVDRVFADSGSAVYVFVRKGESYDSFFHIVEEI